MREEKAKDISRLNQLSKRTFGWYVRVRYLGQTHAKFFSDNKYGGRPSARLAALAWRDETEKRIGKPRTDRHIVTVSNTQTGVVGVRLNEKLNRYEVSWVTFAGRQGKTSVSVRKYGKKEALQRAIGIRKEKEQIRLSPSAI